MELTKLLALLAFATAWWLSPSPTSSAAGPGLCSSLNNHTDCYFSEGYWEARSKFRRAAAAAGAELHTLAVVPGGDYTTDVAVLAGGGQGLMIHSIGVHGVEGYAGSAVQLALLERLAREPDKAAGDAPTVVLVHAVNPFGMAHFRRWNEHNVDLNRNALLPGRAWEEVLARDPNVAGYFDFTAFINPQRAPSLFDAYVRIPVVMAYHVLRFGMLHMKRALVAAQYTDPTGLFYGGAELEPSWRLLWDFLERFDGGSYKGVTWVDVHTGLGRSGGDTLLTSAGWEEMERRYPGAGAVQDESAGEGDVGGGYELTRGFCRELMQHRFAPEARLQHFSQEFGTLPGVLVARAMVLENQAWNYAQREQAYWASFTRDAFYVRTPAWKESIVRRGVLVAEQAMARAQEVAKE